MAQGVIEKAGEVGLGVPDDVSVTGFDDSPLATESFPALTTGRQPTVEMGEAGARMLLRSFEAGKLPTGKVQLGVSLIVRNSTQAIEAPTV